MARIIVVTSGKGGVGKTTSSAVSPLVWPRREENCRDRF